MTITVEIGTPEQNRQISIELNAFVEGLSNLEQAPPLAAIIVPADFEATVRTMEHRNDYSAQRGIPGSSITASAKIVYDGATASIVLSRDLYTSSNDTLTRLFTFLHEVIHVSNKSKLPKPPQQYSLALYHHNVHAMYDEYMADRLAYNIIDSTIDLKTGI